jgi:hypothetical protein
MKVIFTGCVLKWRTGLRPGRRQTATLQAVRQFAGCTCAAVGPVDTTALRKRILGPCADGNDTKEQKRTQRNRKEQLFLHFFFCSCINRGQPNTYRIRPDPTESGLFCGNTRARRPCHYDRLTLHIVLFTLAVQTGRLMFCHQQKQPHDEQGRRNKN